MALSLALVVGWISSCVFYPDTHRVNGGSFVSCRTFRRWLVGVLHYISLAYPSFDIEKEGVASDELIVHI